jgi:hypothetical protein
MSKLLLRTGVLALAYLVVIEFQVNAAEKPAEEFDLQSEYSDTPFFGFNRQVSVGVTIGGGGSGSGVLTLDPNIRKGRESTLIAIQNIPVKLKLVQDKTETAKGRRLYELREVGLEGQVDAGPVRWLLAVPLKAGAPCWLMSVDENGKFQDIVMLKHR